MEEIAVVINCVAPADEPKQVKQSSASQVALNVLETLSTAKSFTQYPYDKQDEGIQQTVDLIESKLKNAPKVLLECVECLLIGARLLKSHQFSLKVSSVTL